MNMCSQEQYLTDLANARLMTIFELNRQVAELQAQIRGHDAVFVSLVLDALARVPLDREDHTVRMARSQCYLRVERSRTP
jgi:hypothetical protein